MLVMKEFVAFSGKIGQVVHTTQPDGRIFERYRRAPGVRLVIISPDKKILISREKRHEAKGWDLRLPGGKVCDTVEEYEALVNSGQSMLEAAQKAAIKEALEETGLIIRDPQLIIRATAGATVEWDLYYFKIEQFTESPGGQELEAGEDITIKWMDVTEAITAIENGQMQEWRSAGVLLAKVLPGLQ
jgi:ADP-ribose pyrophosphatase